MMYTGSEKTCPICGNLTHEDVDQLTTITRERDNWNTIVTAMSKDEAKVRDILVDYDKSDSYVVEPLHELAGRITEENAKLRAELRMTKLDIDMGNEIICSCKDEIKTLRAALERLASSEAFKLPGLIGPEVKARIEYARNAIEEK